MGTFDMPMTELIHYGGRTPCPQNFDSYWTDALRQLADIPPSWELVPANISFPQAECYDLYFTGVGGSRIHAKFLRPSHTGTRMPAVLQFHGYGCSAGDWWDKLPFVQCGFAVAAMDCRGQYGLSEDRGGVRGNTQYGHIIRGLFDSPDKLLFRQIFLDTVRLAEILSAMPEIDATRLHALGGSQGGGLALACAALYPQVRSGVVMYPFLSDYRRVWEMDLARDSYKEITDYFRAYDPMHRNEDMIFENLGYIDVQHLTRRIQGNVLWGIGMMETICPPSAQFAAYNKLTSHKRMCIYPDFGHEPLPGFMDEALSFMLQF